MIFYSGAQGEAIRAIPHSKLTEGWKKMRFFIIPPRKFGILIIFGKLPPWNPDYTPLMEQVLEKNLIEDFFLGSVNLYRTKKSLWTLHLLWYFMLVNAILSPKRSFQRFFLLSADLSGLLKIRKNIWGENWKIETALVAIKIDFDNFKLKNRFLSECWARFLD